MKSQGLGDTIEKITKATGIKALVDKNSKEDCVPCAERKRLLNNPNLLINKVFYKQNLTINKTLYKIK